ncbi:hypothetical protein ABH912_004066 [Pseudomonas sp. BT76 TE3572]|uniref:DUF6957 family protein n=1 Tax=Pseudomonas sp. BT76 TE3572 TaxID=3349325 RepID=UPI003D1F89AB
MLKDASHSNRFFDWPEERMNLAGFTSLLSAGEKTSGCQLANPDAVALANLHFPSRACCLVADWAILDIEVTTRQRKAITDRGLIPALVYALTVIQDSKGRFPPGDWVRTTLAVSFTHGCLFETKNTIYVLMGFGRRLRTDLDIALSLC